MAHNYWDYNTLAAGLEKCGPWIDCAVGTQGKYTSLNAAIAAGHTKIVLLPGSTLTADLTITANGVHVIGFRHAQQMTLGSYKITVSGNSVILQGFQIDGAAGVGIEITGIQGMINNVSVINCGSHGLFVNSTYGAHNIIASRFRDNDINAGSDGIRMSAGGGAYTRIIGCDCTSNSGYGINDLSNTAIILGNDCHGNTSGGINGSSTYVAANAT